MLRGLFPHAVFDQTVNFCSVLHTVTVGKETGVFFPLGVTQAITQHAEESVVAAAEENVSVKCAVTSVWYD
jgi:hypothetical protein